MAESDDAADCPWSGVNSVQTMTLALKLPSGVFIIANRAKKNDALNQNLDGVSRK
jgi:hypothetical protein